MTQAASLSVSKVRRWSESETAKLKELKARGIALAEIALILGRSHKSVEHRLYDKPIVAVERCRSRELTEKEIAWLARHYKNTPNADIQRRLSLSHSGLHRLARKLGLKKTRQFMAKAQAAAQKAAAASHRANGTYPPKGYRIPNSEAGNFKPGKGRGVWERVSKSKAAEMKAKAKESIKRTRKAERARWLFGFEQKTRLRFTQQPKDKVSYRYGLRKCGYIEDALDHNLYFYPSDEMRRPMREANGAKFHIRFEPLSARATANSASSHNNH